MYQLTAKGERELAVWAEALERQHRLMSSHVRRFRGAVSESQPPEDASGPDRT
jgi:DNA-binding PadR family transcriptional regulator